MSIWSTLGLAPRPFITKLIQENILQDYERNGKNYIYFTFDQMNDYFSAKTILSMYQTEEEIRKFICEKVLEIVDGEIQKLGEVPIFFTHVCALYAEKFGKECIDIIQEINNNLDREDLFRVYIESFEWRNKICASVSELRKLCENYSLEYSDLWDQIYNAEVTVLTNNFIDNYMPEANGEFVKVYIYLLRLLSDASVPFSLEQMADHFFCTERDIVRALKYWEKSKSPYPDLQKQRRHYGHYSERTAC